MTFEHDDSLECGVNIKVIGVGGGGNNAVNRMIVTNIRGVDFVSVNTDRQALRKSEAPNQLVIGEKITKGFGAGAEPEVGKRSAEESIDAVKEALNGADMVFITAGMGGGTGSGAAPVVAKIAKEKGILTVGVVTKPFQFEGKKRSETAESALENFTKEVDSIIVIPNQNLFRIADKNTTLADAFVMADNVLYDGVRSITDLMIMPGLINLDFADVKAIMEDKGKAIMGTGEAEGEDRAIRAAEQALANPLLDDCSMKGAKGVLINITASQDITLMEVDDAVNRIKEEVDEDANIIFGSSFDGSLEGKVRVSIVATGIDDKGRKTVEVTRKIEPVKRQEYIEPIVQMIEPKPAITEEPIETSMNRMEEVLQQISDDMDDEKNSSIDDVVEESIVENIVAKNYAEEPQQRAVFDDFDSLDKSEVMSDMPNSSALFKAIINKQEAKEDVVVDEDKLFNEAISAQDSPFVPKTALRMPEKEMDLFPNHNPVHVVKPVEEEEQLIVSEPEPRRSRFIDMFTGRSIAKRNMQRQTPRVQEPVTPAFMDNMDDKVNLEIPSFLRRK